MKRTSLITLTLLQLLSLIISTSTTCHPQCSWKCDDPHCPAICDPVCEPPKCHTSCAEPKNAICDVKCEKPECEIKCPDRGCAGLDCPKCVTVCKQPHCVTHCQAPKPECEPVCEEPKCDWKCHKPQCPKPKCELVCENPNCTPKVECCPCENGMRSIQTPFPMFKETETNKECCSCGNNNGFPRYKQVVADNAKDFDTRPQSKVIDTQNHFMKIDKTAKVSLMKQPVKIGTSVMTDKHAPQSEEFLAAKEGLNIDRIYKENNNYE